MIFGWYDLREYNRSNTDNSFEVILWANNTFEYRYGGLNIINHDVLIGEIGSGTSQSYTYLYHDECSTGTTNIAGTCVNTNFNNTSFNTLLENGGSLYGVGTGNAIDCSDPLNSSSCSGYAAAYLTQQCNITQLYSESCPSYWEAYDDQQCDEDPQYAPFCAGYTQEASVAYYIEEEFDYGYQDNTQDGSFSFNDNFGYEEDIFTYIEEFNFETEPQEQLLVFEYEEVFIEFNFEEPFSDDIDPLPDFNVINDVYDIQVFDEPEFLLSHNEFDRNDVITINPSEELIEEFILQETVLIEDFEQINTFVEFETIEELDEWFEEEIIEEREESQEEIEEELYAEEEVFEEEVVEEVFEEIEEQFAEERVAVEEREEEVLEEEEVELIAEETTSRSGITSSMLNVVNQSIRTASNSNASSSSSSTGYSSGNNSGGSSNVNSGVASSSVSGSGISTSSSPSMSDQIASANVQTNTILSLSQDTSSMSGGSSQTVSSVSTVITPMPTFDNNPQIVMADVQVNNMQGEIDTAISGVMTASEADQIADEIIANNIKEQQEQAETEQEETGKYGDETTLVAFLGYVPGFDVYKDATIPQVTTWYEPKEIYTNASISDNINAFYGLARTNLNTMQNLINQQPNL
jgi:hypothetical protein